MQILHRFVGSIQEYATEISDADRYRPEGCPQCEAKCPLAAHGFYCRTLVDVEFDGKIHISRYLCHFCKRTVSLLPEFALPYLRFSISVIRLFLVARLLAGSTLQAAAQVAGQAHMPYQRGQFWIRRLHKQAAGLCADRRHAVQAGELEAALDGALVTGLELAIDERFQGLRKAEIFGGGVSQHLIQMEAHGRQVQLMEFLLQ